MRKSAQRLASIYVDVPALRPGTIGAYSLAFVCAGVAAALQVAIDPYLAGAHYITFFLAVIITALIGGFGAGLFCLALSVAAVDFFLLQSHFFYVDLFEVPALLLFTLAGLSSVILITGMRFVVEREHMQTSKDRLQFTLDMAKLGSWQYDPRGRVLTGDTRFKEIFDVTTDEMPIEDLKKLVHPDDAERFWADREASIDLADPMRSPSHEYRVQRRNGEVRWVEVRWFAYFDGDRRERGTASVVGTVLDITERKWREERERLLMSEINHRAKNLLSVVHAIAHQTATRTPEDFIERFSERIRSLSANQDLLIRNAWQGVEIEALVRAQLAPFADLMGSRIVVDGPKLRLNAASAQAIGLALHELATNAGKYGALSTDAGRVDIGWGTDGDTFTMSWAERDGPPVSGPQRRGFGTVVMEAMAERRVDGTVDLNYAASGLTWRLACPASNAMERQERGLHFR